ncbi:MAG: hypothetical protein E7062_00640 [Spirochaetaceae bacterium]|nr:hypothetical protein [Spirochaetaceae bacterium]
MSSRTNIFYLFRKYPLFRFAVLVFIVLLLVIFSLITTKATEKKPSITELDPPIASPEEIITIVGKNFGDVQNDSYVEIDNNRLSSSAYLKWTDTEIAILLPHNIQDGLVYVVTQYGHTNPKVFSNVAGIPIPIEHTTEQTLPIITQIKEKKFSIGSEISLIGKNFGSVRKNSKVVLTFSETDKNQKKQNYELPIPEDNFVLWSPLEIRFKIPDGARNGKLTVITDKGKSNELRLALNNMPGTKKFTDKKNYLIRISAEISQVQTEAPGTITLRIPHPPVTSSQQNVEIITSSREPTLFNYQDAFIHHLNFDKSLEEPISISHDLLITNHVIRTSIQQEKVVPYSENSKKLYAEYLVAEQDIFSDNAEIIALAKAVTRGQTNILQKSRSIYNYVLNNYELMQNIQNDEDSFANLLEKKIGDAYDYTMFFCSLLRAANIIARPLNGILIDANMNNQYHWWVEIYLENFGFFPIDIVIPAGLDYKAFPGIQTTKEFYFGNLDSQHITFSQGLPHSKQIHIGSNTVSRKKTYSLQNIWEESTSEIKSYSSFWNTIYIQGIYQF